MKKRRNDDEDNEFDEFATNQQTSARANSKASGHKQTSGNQLLVVQSLVNHAMTSYILSPDINIVGKKAEFQATIVRSSSSTAPLLACSASPGSE